MRAAFLVLIPLLLASTCQTGGPGLGYDDIPGSQIPNVQSQPAASAPATPSLDGVWRVELPSFDVFCILVESEAITHYQAGCVAAVEVTASSVSVQSDVGGIVEFNTPLPSTNPGNYRLYITSKPSDFVWAVSCIRSEVTPTGTDVSDLKPGIMSRI